MDNAATDMTEALIPICELKPGERGTVVRLAGDSGLRQHLLEMGFTTGTEVEFVRAAPLGDPVDLRLRGYRLSLRRVEASVVIVRPIVEETISQPGDNANSGVAPFNQAAHQAANH